MIPDRIEVNIAGGLDVALPRMVNVRQKFEAERLTDIAGTIAREFQRPEVREPRQARAGRRGRLRQPWHRQHRRDRQVRRPRAAGAGRHSLSSSRAWAATAPPRPRARRKCWRATASREAATGVPIRASMETVIVGQLADGTPVHMDRYAAEADGIVVINRIKPHTAFRGATESGLTKMLSIGIGKIIGASTYHTHGMDRFPRAAAADPRRQHRAAQCPVRRRHRGERLRRDGADRDRARRAPRAPRARTAGAGQAA